MTPNQERNPMHAPRLSLAAILSAAALLFSAPLGAQVAVVGQTVYTMAGEPIHDGVVIVRDGKIATIGPVASTPIPAGFEVLQAAVVTPGLIDAHATVGLSGLLNQPGDQDHLDPTAAIQPELRAIDAYNALDPLVAYVRSFGVTTVHTGHSPGAAISGQTMVVKTTAQTVDRAAIRPAAMIAVALGSNAIPAKKDKSPGTRSKVLAMLRAELIKAQEYERKCATPDADKRPPRDLRLETLVRALHGEQPLLIHAQRHLDIIGALRLAREFSMPVVIDGGADLPLVLDEVRAAGVPVILHPTMARPAEELENLGMATAARLKAAGIPFALQSGYEAYVPKTRLVLFEAAVAHGHGLAFDDALAAITIDAARIIGVADRVGSLEPGKDGDLALYDGNPFEYTSHCIGVVIDGQVVSREVH